jgi:hypothetical protein
MTVISTVQLLPVGAVGTNTTTINGSSAYGFNEALTITTN